MTLEASLCCKCQCSAYPASCEFASGYYVQPLSGRVAYSKTRIAQCGEFQCWTDYDFACEIRSSSPIVAHRIVSGGNCLYRAFFNVRVRGHFRYTSTVIGTGAPGNPGNNGTQEAYVDFTNTAEGCMIVSAGCGGCICDGTQTPQNQLSWFRQINICNFRMGTSAGVSDYECLETGFDDPEPDSVFMNCSGGGMNHRSPWGDPRNMEFAPCRMLTNPDDPVALCYPGAGPDYYANVLYPWGVFWTGQGDTPPDDCAPYPSAVANQPIAYPTFDFEDVGSNYTVVENGSIQCGNWQAMVFCPFTGREFQDRTFNIEMSGGRFT